MARHRVGGARGERRLGWIGGWATQPLAALPYALLTNQAASGHLYAGLGNGEAWHADDHGDTWRQLPFNVGAIHHAVLLP